MKLVEILARELEKWPLSTDCITQNDDSTKVMMKKIEVLFNGGCWVGADGVSIEGFIDGGERADDYKTAIVTREMWQAERERIAKPAKKANAEGWIRNRGRKCPVQSGTLVDLKLRGGVIHIGKFCDNHPWIHKGEPFDVMYYRINKTAEQPADQGIYADDTGPAVAPVSVVYADSDCPLVWRDRIREIDRTVEALEEERVSLIQRLEGEGLQLLQGKVCGSVQPVEDMSDWRNWKVGDLAKVTSRENGHQFDIGDVVRITNGPDRDGGCICCECLDGSDYWSLNNSEIKFHSRPSA